VPELNGGVVPAIPTPLLANEDVDSGALCKVVDHVVDSGASGVFVLGTMGEGQALLDSQRCVAVETAAAHLDGRVPLLAGISEVSTRRTLETGKLLQQAGSDYLVTTGPYFHSFPSPESTIALMTALGDALDKPLVYYDCPGRTGNRVSADTLDAIMNMPFVAAIKDTSLDLHLQLELLRRYPDKDSRPCQLFQADESVFDVALLMGADGVVGGAVTVLMDAVVPLYDAGVRGDVDEARRLQREFTRRLVELLGPEAPVYWMQNVKRGLRQLGIGDDTVTSPYLRRDE